MDAMEYETELMYCERWPPEQAFGICSDGSYQQWVGRGARRRRITPKAGWGFAVFANAAPAASGDALARRCGHVALDEMDPWFVNAVRLSNGTAELQGALEVCIWLMEQLEWESPVIPRGSNVQTVFDASYVIGVVTGSARPRQNVA